MNTAIPAALSWSGGKDSTLALERVRDQGIYEVRCLFTSLSRDYGRISMHGVRESLLDAQAAALGLPVEKIWLEKNWHSDDYERVIGTYLAGLQARGIGTIIHGDLFLEEIRAYRETMLARLGMKAVFPLWGENTTHLASYFADRGYQAWLTCVDTRQLDSRFAGRLLDHSLLAELPAGVDPCGERGEYHSFVVDGPMFKQPVPAFPGERVLRDEHFLFVDLLDSPA